MRIAACRGVASMSAAVASVLLAFTAVAPLAVALFVVAPLAAAQPSPLPNQQRTSPRVPQRPSTTPPGGDTVGYWQQRADYRIVATLDERRGEVVATGTLRYVNQSPDVLRELWGHQHLNAFRPGSKWSEADARDGRVRFQNLTDPDYAYERFTAPPRVNGRPVTVEYPLAPDSTVFRVALPVPLAPGDSLTVDFAWTARPSTVPRRQGRRGRSFDFAQWYPKVAVYDREGWKPNALVPSGEFYGEFGTFDVTLVLPTDQTVGATGVPVSGDPGYARVRAAGSELPRLAAQAYRDVPPAPALRVPSGYKAVRFVARQVHHFAWSTSPGFRYEGSSYVRAPSQPYRFPIWDTVSVHVLYRADAVDDCARASTSLRSEAECVDQSLTQWQGGRALAQARTALRWLEALYGDYPYPQITVLKRLDASGTEFPMLLMNGEASVGLTVHELGHVYTYGILANNEWQSGWLDEGLSSYQEALQAGDSRVLLAARLEMAGERDPAQPRDTVLRALRARLDALSNEQAAAVRNGTAEPIGTRADLFRSMAVYNASVYDRGQAMYQALHDVMGEELFQRFLRAYYATWQFRHVDRWAMQTVAEQTSAQSLGWFFNQWVQEVGVVDYALRAPVVRTEQVGGRTQWIVTASLTRAGRYRHPMPVGVRTRDGWTLWRANPLLDTQVVQFRLDAAPDALWLDPYGSTESPTARYYRISLPSR